MTFMKKKAELELTIIDLENQNNKLEEELNNTLFPFQNELHDKLKNYQDTVSYQQSLIMCEDMVKQYRTNFTEYEKVEAEIDFNPRNLFADDFVIELANNYRDILIAMNFTPVETVQFNMAAFDMIYK